MAIFFGGGEGEGQSNSGTYGFALQQTGLCPFLGMLIARGGRVSLVKVNFVINMKYFMTPARYSTIKKL